MSENLFKITEGKTWNRVIEETKLALGLKVVEADSWIHDDLSDSVMCLYPLLTNEKY